jgi:transposase-like protein
LRKRRAIWTCIIITCCAIGLGSSGPDPAQAFPGQGQMKPEQAEIERLRREVAKLKAERDILKKAAAYFAKDQT